MSDLASLLDELEGQLDNLRNMLQTRQESKGLAVHSTDELNHALTHVLLLALCERLDA